MDCKRLHTWAGAALLLGSAVSFACYRHASPWTEGSGAADAPGLLTAGPVDQCSWKRLDADLLGGNQPPAPQIPSGRSAAIRKAPRPVVEVAPAVSAEGSNSGSSTSENQLPATAPAATPQQRHRTEPLPPVAHLAEPPASASADANEPPALFNSSGEPSPAAGQVPVTDEAPLKSVRVKAVGELPLASSEPDPSVAEADDAAPADAPTQTKLPWARADRHTREMNAVLNRADERVRHGFMLAGHGAVYSARAEFIAALQIIAQANDTKHGTQVFGRGLSSGLTALKEAGVFFHNATKRSTADVGKLIATHKTTILKDEDLATMTTTVAAQRYYTFAQEQFAIAAASEMNGSMALFGLAKVAEHGAMGSAIQPLERTAQAMALYQAALMADGHNFLAANELAVLEVGNDNLKRARDLLVHSISLAPHPATWQNLVVVHTRLGENQLAAEAQARLMAMQKAGRSGPTPAVQWLDPAEFARMTSTGDGLLSPNSHISPTAAAPASAPATQPPTDVAKKGLTDKIPWIRR